MRPSLFGLICDLQLWPAAAELLDQHARLIRSLEKEGRLDRALEYLPDEEVIAERTAAALAHKCDAARWLELQGKVHAAGLKTNATMLYGHIESIEDRVDHFVKLREQQEKSGGFQCFIPLAFYPPDTQLAHLPGPSGVDSLKTMAVSRLMLDNFDHIKAYWVMLGKRLAQVALHYGANDIDGTITEGGELTTSYSVETNNEVRMSKTELIGLIEDAGYEAVERDTVYNRIEPKNLTTIGLN